MYLITQDDQIIDSQFEPEAAANLKAAGGGEMILKEIIKILSAQTSCFFEIIMKTHDWLKYLQTELRRHGKKLFTVTELANAAGVPPHTVNVELNRLVKKDAIFRYAHGKYGLPAVLRPTGPQGFAYSADLSSVALAQEEVKPLATKAGLAKKGKSH